MTDTSVQFVGSIPEIYDSGLGPNIFHDYADDLVRRARAVGGRDVLEIAAGTGIVSRRLRDALPEARLVVTDLNPPMLDVARRKFAGDENVEFLQADAQALPFGDAEFDLAVCQFGVMFLPDKPAAFREAARILRPGGHYVFNTWGSASANPFAQIAQDVVIEFFPEDPPGFYRVPVSYSDPAVVGDDLRAAGWQDFQHETIRLTKTVADPGAFAHAMVHGNPLGTEIRQRGGVDPDAVVAAILARLLARFGRDPMTMPLQTTAFVCRAP